MSLWKKDRGQKNRLYVDAAAATPLSKRAKQELIRLLDLYGNPGALHREAVDAKKELDHARGAIAQAIGAHSDEIIFTASGTEANNLAIQGTLRSLLEKHTNLHALTCAIEHHSVLDPLRALSHTGLSVTELPVDAEGLVSPKKLAEAITDTTVFVSIQFINSEIGTIQPIRAITKELRRVRKDRLAQENTLPLYIHTDASQAPLWLPVMVEKLGIDLLTLDAQKILGPKGVGALYIRRGVQIEPILRGSKQERGLRGGTENTPLIGAFAIALVDAQKGVTERAIRIALVRDICIEEIKALIPDARINGPTASNRIANNINVSIPGLDREMGVIALDSEGVAATTRSACNVVDKDPSHVIKAIGTPPELYTTAMRFTFLPDAKKQDAHRVAQTLAEIAKRYRIVV